MRIFWYVLQIWNLELADNGPRRGLEAVLDGSSALSFEYSQISAKINDSPIRSLHFSGRDSYHERLLLVGLESGEMKVLAQDSDYLRQRLQRKLTEIGIL